MKKNIISVSLLVLSVLSIAAVSRAEIRNIRSNFTNIIGDIGSAANRVTNGYFTNLDTNTETINTGILGGTLTIEGTATTTLSGSGAASTFGGVVLASSGTVTAPGFSFSDDTNTGIYGDGNNDILFSTAGTARFTLGSALNGSAANSAQVKPTNASLTAPTLIPNRSDTSVGIGGIAGSLSLISGGASIMTVNDSGFVGIGTSTPSQFLEIYGATTTMLQVISGSSTDTAALILKNTTRNWRISTAGSNDGFRIIDTTGGTTPFFIANAALTNTFIISTAGNSGFRQVSPSSTLSISGDFALSGSSTVRTASIGGGSLAAGGCASATSTVDASVASSSSAFATTPQNYPGAGFSWGSYVSAANVLTTQVCAMVTGTTPTATSYVVKIFK